MLLARVAEGFELAVGFLAITVPDARKPVDERADEPRFEVPRVNVGLALHDIVPQQHEMGDQCQTLHVAGVGVGTGAASSLLFCRSGGEHPALTSSQLIPCVIDNLTSVGVRGIRLENPGEVESGIADALAHDGPVLIDAVVSRMVLPVPPSITTEMAKGFTLYMLKAVMAGLGDELVDLARTNLWQ
jgi:hypothetical protein